MIDFLLDEMRRDIGAVTFLSHVHVPEIRLGDANLMAIASPALEADLIILLSL